MENEIFLLCGHQQEEPNELRCSRPAPWEVGGAVPLPDPIAEMPTDDRATTNRLKISLEIVV